MTYDYRSVFDGGIIRAEFEKAGIKQHFIPLIWKYVFAYLFNIFALFLKLILLIILELRESDVIFALWMIDDDEHRYVIENPNCEWDEFPSLPSAAYSLLRSKFKPLTSTLHSVVDSSDDVTTKLLVKLQVGTSNKLWFYEDDLEVLFQKLSVSTLLKKHLFRKCFTSKLHSILANII